MKITENRDESEVKQGLILAAGRGTRLGDITAEKPKPLVEIKGKPLLEWILKGFRTAGIERTVVVIGYKGEEIAERFGEGEEFDMKIDYVEQDLDNYGTAAALSQARSALRDRPFVLSYGDVITSYANYERLIARYRVKRYPVILLSWNEKISQGGLVHHDLRRYVEKIEEKPDVEGGGWNSAGVFVLTPEIFHWLDEVEKSERDEYELPDAVNLMLKNGGHMMGCRAAGLWRDVGRKQDIEWLEERLEETSSI